VTFRLEQLRRILDHQAKIKQLALGLVFGEQGPQPADDVARAQASRLIRAMMRVKSSCRSRSACRVSLATSALARIAPIGCSQFSGERKPGCVRDLAVLQLNRELRLGPSTPFQQQRADECGLKQDQANAATPARWRPPGRS